MTFPASPHGGTTQASSPLDAVAVTPLDDDEQLLLDRVPKALATGVALLEWWRDVDRRNAYTAAYDETFVFNRPEDTSFGFFERAEILGQTLKINGNVQQMFYDEPKSPPSRRADLADWTAEQVREFVLHYFLRISSYRRPQRLPEPSAQPAPPILDWLSQCPRDSDQRSGFGFTQIFGGPTGSPPGSVYRFRDTEQHAILDLHRLGAAGGYDWVMLRNPIFDFGFELKVADTGPRLVLPLGEFNYLVTSRDFVIDQERPEPGIRGRYGLGYAFVRKPEPNVLGYGPGELEPAFELLVWDVHDSGKITVRATFVAEEPTAMLRLAADPFLWGFQMADVLGGPTIKDALRPWKRFYNSLPMSGLRFDPVFPAIRLLNLATLGQAEKRLCISTTQLKKEFLYLHFLQHYQTLVGSLQTWRQIPDWLDRAALPPFVVDGLSV